MSDCLLVVTSDYICSGQIANWQLTSGFRRSEHNQNRRIDSLDHKKTIKGFSEVDPLDSAVHLFKSVDYIKEPILFVGIFLVDITEGCVTLHQVLPIG